MKSLILAAVCTSGLFAQAPSAAGPMSDEIKGLFNQVKGNLIKSAEKMPEENYAFKPTPEVRSFAQLIGHVADAGYMFCSPILAEADRKKSPGVEKGMSKKAELVQALKDSMAYCDTAYAALTDAKAASKASFFGRERTLMTIMSFNVAHDNEHYGNVVTYLRLKGIVPPSSEGR